jgi:hypothetical protein
MNCFWIYYELSRTQDLDTREDCVEHFDIISTLILLAQSAKRILAVFASSISPTINISIVFICAFLVDYGRIICHSAIKNDSSAML